MLLRRGFIVLALFVLSACGMNRSTPGLSSSPFDTAGKNQISTDVGAGGSGVYCPGKNGTRPYFEVLDVYEARKRGMAPGLAVLKSP